jgi:hypothetical protein
MRKRDNALSTSRIVSEQNLPWINIVFIKIRTQNRTYSPGVNVIEVSDSIKIVNSIHSLLYRHPIRLIQLEV